MHLFSLINAVISETGSQSNNPCFVTALLSAHFNSHRLCEGLVYHGFSYYPVSDHCVKVGSDFLQQIINLGNVIDLLHSVIPI